MADAKHSRAADELDLEMLLRRGRGQSLLEVAAALGVTGATVGNRTEAIRSADRAQSGEDPAAVDRAYWRRRPR